ncbi:unnamed protein product [Vitrella brassicaformis CCMP3155]|uniref:ASPIC/UnbV domain-containing protein n=1 Tax=Vitrella brassicaformis (strain CCMP3155) TaxID=1169540 RepID=A0A0G4GL18_VITBC|nr:unnamed protein product [Vitrella brassicaformis CCMP3155]|eukprot:CEM30718.1 unnamed protein product [Vitrella brassicaformis CCMP3155]
MKSCVSFLVLVVLFGAPSAASSTMEAGDENGTTPNIDLQLFDDVTEAAGLTSIKALYVSWGSSWGDMDGDGDPDLWVSNHYSRPVLYENLGDGTFRNVRKQRLGKMYGDLHTASWVDFDNDGDQDLVVLHGGRRATGKEDNQVFVNDGSGHFSERAEQLGLTHGWARGRAPLWFDSNDDGRLDVLFTALLRPDGRDYTRFFRQKTDGTFVPDESAGYDTPKSPVTMAYLTDVNGDQKLDVVEASYWRFPIAVFDTMDPTAAQRMKPPFLAKPVKDVAFADLNGDAFIDAIVPPYVRRNIVIQRNESRVEFHMPSVAEEIGIDVRTEGALTIQFQWKQRVLIGSNGYPKTFGNLDPEFNRHYRLLGGITNAEDVFSLDPADAKNQGIARHTPGVDNGIYIGYFPSEGTWRVLNSGNPSRRISGILSSSQKITSLGRIGFSSHPKGGARIFIWNPKESRYDEKTYKSGLSAAGDFGSESIVAGDFDNDCDVDFYVVTTTTLENTPNRLYLNDGTGNFVLSPNAGGAAGTSTGIGDAVTAADYDCDGALDMFVANGGGTGRNRVAFKVGEGKDQLFRNRGNSNGWLEIDLEGTASNRDGIGATVFVEVGGKTQVRERGNGMHSRSQDHARLHFGLGTANSVDRLTVRWPSGQIDVIKNIAANRAIRVKEGGTIHTVCE